MNITTIYEELPEPVFQDMKKAEKRKSDDEIAKIIDGLLKEIQELKK